MTERKNEKLRYMDTLSSNIYCFFKDNKLTDFTLIVGNKDINVHSLVIAEKSDVFKAEIMSNSKETKKCLIEDFDEETVQSGIKFMYLRTLENERCTPDLLRFANKFFIKSLFNFLENYFVESV